MEKESFINLTLFRKVIFYLKPYKKLFVLAVFLTLLIAFLGPLRPALIGSIVTDYIVESKNIEKLFQWTAVVVALLLAETIIQIVNTYISNFIAQSVIRDLRKKLLGHILNFNTKYFDNTPVGALVTRVVSDIEAISEVFSSGLMDIVGDLLTLIVVIFWMFYLNWELSLLTLVPLPLLIIATRMFARAMQSSFQMERTQVAKLNTFVQERITGMNIVQLFGTEKKEMRGFEHINKDHRQAHIKAVWATSIFFPIVDLMSSLAIAFLLVYGAVKYSGSSSENIKLMFGEILAFTLYIQMLFRPIRQLADKFNILQRGLVRAERVFMILEDQSPIQSKGDVKKINFLQKISFKNVSFAYQEGTPVLKQINLDIEPGTTVAFVGATGAGKSTMINLLSRFYDIQEGEIMLGDTNIKDVDIHLLRQNIAVVLQDVFLFSDSIYQNITLGNESITREEVVEAAKSVGIHEFIMTLPNDYDFVLGERGGTLSVGQRQLLSFIRAKVYNPTILVLDEATSSIDSESEMLIQKATEDLTKSNKERTSIIIAHRMSTIQNADKIIVLDKGEIVEIGTHQELLMNNGAYKKLYEMQFA